MIKIGILPTYNHNNKSLFLDTESFVNNYINRINELGAVPVGILFPKGKFDKRNLEDLDGIIIPGGNHIQDYQVLTVHYAIENKKPLIGICLGHQAIKAYDYLSKKIKNDNLEVNYENLSKYFNKNIEKQCLNKIKNHNLKSNIYKCKIDKINHEVLITENTKLYKIFNKKTKNFASFHNYVIKNISNNFIINAKSNEGYIEGIEYRYEPFIIGVQFHPEINPSNNILFQEFINKCNKQK